MKILVASDGSDQAGAAISLMGRLTGFQDHEFVLLSVSDARDVALISAPVPGAFEQLLENLDQEARDALKAHSRLFSGAETVQIVHLRGDAADTILKTAEEIHANLIVMGSRGLGPISGPLLGSVSSRVAAHSDCSVLLGRSDSPSQEKHIRLILGIDGSAGSQAATRLIGQLPLRSTDSVECVQVLTLVKAFRMDLVQKLSAVWAQEKMVAKQNLKAAETSLAAVSSARISTRLAEGSSAGDMLVRIAEETAADLLVVGHRGLGAVRRFLLGSVSSYVLHHGHCGVLIVKAEGSAAQPGPPTN